MAQRKSPVFDRLVLAGELAGQEAYAWTDQLAFGQPHYVYMVMGPDLLFYRNLRHLRRRAVLKRDPRLAITARDIERTQHV